ncbi:MAG: alpha/beta hydrolase [Thermoleophilia bacterium]|nr:alpha/beta hydrolase [Thermoleophilia bacterium]
MATRHGWHTGAADGREIFARVLAPAGGGERAPGPPVVLVHGLAVSSRYFVRLLEQLGAQHQVWAPDLPGHGRTCGDRRPLRFDELVSVLVAWLDATGLRRAVLVGNSMGGQLVAEVSLRRPDLASAVVLIGATTDTAAPSLGAHALRLLRDMARERPQLVAATTLEYLDCGPRRLLREFATMRDHDLAATLAGSPVPSLLVRGEHDPIAPASWLSRLAAADPDTVDVRTIPGAGHAAHDSHPAEVAAAIRAFLDRRGVQSAG